MRKTILFLSMGILFTAQFSLALSFKIADIHLPVDVKRYEVIDLNGDSLKEIIVFGEEKNNGVSVHILWQTSQGFLQKNVQSFVPDARSIICDFGDIVGDNKMEFLMITNSGIIFYAQQHNQFILKPKQALKVQSVFRVKPRQALPYWNFARNITPQGKDEILVPQFQKTVIYSFADSTWQVIGSLNLPARANIRSLPNLSIDYSLNQIFISDCNQDGLADILSRENDKFNLFFQSNSHHFSRQPNVVFDMKFTPEEPKYAEETSITSIKDINNDGILDLIANKTAARENLLNPQSQIQIYLGKKDARQLWSLTPDQIIVSSGVQFNEQMVDLNGDGKLDLSIPSIQLGLMRIIKILLTKSVTVNVRLFQMAANDKYPEQPNVIKKFTIKFNFNIGNDSASGGGIVPVFNVDGDYNGDGLHDLITTIDQRHLDFYFGKPRQIFSSTANEKVAVVLPKNGNRVKVIDLNGNKRSDIILTYQRRDDKSKKMTKLIRILMN